MVEVRILLSLLAATAVLGVLLGVLVRTGKNRHQLRVQRLQVLQEALKHPALDERTRSELTRVLADDYRRMHRPAGERFGRWLRAGHVLMLALGWLLLISGIGFWIWAENTRLGLHVEPAICATITGAALVTLPLALRELLGRRDRKAATSES